MAPDHHGILSGTIAEFWDFADRADPNSRAFDGYMQLVDGSLRVDAIDHRSTLERFTEGDTPKAPECLIGSSSNGGVMLVNPSGQGSTSVMGGSSASRFNFRYQTLLTGVRVSDLTTTRVMAAEARFPDGIDWGQMPAMSVVFSNRGDGRHRSARIEVGLEHTPEDGPIGDGLRMKLTPRWNISGPDGAKSVRTYLGVEVSSRTPRPIAELLGPLVEVQQLISVANGVHVECAEATATPRLRGGVERLPRVWDRELFREPSRMERPRYPRPKFTLPDLGGVPGIRRWLQLVDQHPRFIRPITLRWQLGRPAVETRILELHSAIEQYVASSRRKVKWATPADTKHALTIFARRCPSAFKEWVGGDAEAWASEFSEINNVIKHNPRHVDVARMFTVGESAEVAIVSVALDYAAQNKTASRKYIQNPNHSETGRRVRDILTGGK